MSYFTSKYYILGLAYATFENHCTLLYNAQLHTRGTWKEMNNEDCEFLMSLKMAPPPPHPLLANICKQSLCLPDREKKD